VLISSSAGIATLHRSQIKIQAVSMNAVENNAKALVMMVPTAPSGTAKSAEASVMPQHEISRQKSRKVHVQAPPDEGVGEPLPVAGSGISISQKGYMLVTMSNIY
jgi:hypothetical protein